MKLAAAVGTADVDGMLDSLDEKTFREWMAYDGWISPIGVDRLDGAIGSFMAIVVRSIALIAEQNGAFKCEAMKHAEPEDFIPWLEDSDSPGDEAMSEDAMKANMESAILLAQRAMR